MVSHLAATRDCRRSANLAMANPEHERTFATERHAVCPKLNDFDLSGLDLRDTNLGGAHLKNAMLIGM